MRIIAKKTLKEFWDRHSNAEGPLRAWHDRAKQENWETPAQVMDLYPLVSILPDNRVVFRIKGNEYRLVVRVFYPGRIVYVRFVGTHAEYDRIDAEKV